MPKMPAVAGRGTWHIEFDEPRVPGKAHTRGDDATAAARRWLPTVTMDPADPLFGTHRPVLRGWEIGAQVHGNRRPAAQWTHLAIGRCDDLFAAGRK